MKLSVQVLGQNDARATFYATLINSFITLFGVAGGLMADLAWGKLKVQATTSWVWMSGVLLLLLAVATPDTKYGGGGDSDSSTGPAPPLSVLLLSAAGLLLLSAGYGAQQPSQSAFIGEQAEMTNTATPPQEQSLLGNTAVRGEHALGLNNPPSHPSCATGPHEKVALLRASQPEEDNAAGSASMAGKIAAFYSWFYFWENFGAVLGETVCPVLRQHVSFTSLFLCVLACQVLGIWALVAARNKYNMVPPERAVVFLPEVCSLHEHAAGTAPSYLAPAEAATDTVGKQEHTVPAPVGAYHCCLSQYCIGFPRVCVLLCGAADTKQRTAGVWVALQTPGGGTDTTRTQSASPLLIQGDNQVVEGPHTAGPRGHSCCSTPSRSANVPGDTAVQHPSSGYTAKDWASIKRVGALFIPITVFWALYFQQNNYWVTQAQDTNTALVWHTPDALGSVNDVMVCVLVPLFSSFVYPAFERCGLACTPLRRIGVGIAAAALAFVAAALLQLAIASAPPQQLSVAWQLPQYFLISISETCIAVTGLEFAYTQVTAGTRGAVQAMWTLTQLGQLLTGAVALAQVGSLADKFFFFAGSMAVFGVVFVVLAVRYRYATPADVA